MEIRLGELDQRCAHRGAHNSYNQHFRAFKQPLYPVAPHRIIMVDTLEKPSHLGRFGRRRAIA